MIRNFIGSFFSLLFLAFFLPSCINEKKAIYFNDVNNESIAGKAEAMEPVIQKNDLLSISVSSLSPEASAVFNTPNVGGATSASNSNINVPIGYLVGPEGYIQFPVVGNIKAAGLTKTQLRDTITRLIIDKKLLIDPIVNVRHLNFRVTVLGEVSRPAVINVPSEKISLLEALGQAGDITIDAKRNNVLLIREENGEKITRRIDLNSKQFLSSAYYYLKSNDVVYVEPNKDKIANSSYRRSLQWLPIIASTLSLVVILATRYR